MKPHDLLAAPVTPVRRPAIYVIALLLVLAACLFLFHARRVDLSFDGAMNMQVPKNRIEHGRYATSYHGFTDFSAAVQTGPTVLFPAELAIRALGPTTLAAQLPNVAYLLAALVLAAAALRRLVPDTVLPLAVVLWLCTPDLLDYGMRGYGEVPGLCFILVMIVMLSPSGRETHLPLWRAAGAGLALGLAYLTKTVMLIAVPALVIAVLYDLLVTRRMRIPTVLVLSVTAALPVLAFEAWKFGVLGSEGYAAWWDNQSGSIMVQAGVSSGMLDTPGFWSKLSAHLDVLSSITSLPRGELELFLVGPYAALAAYVAVPALRSRTAVPTHLVILTGAALTYIVWWNFMTPTSRAWSRRIMVGLMLHELVILVTLVVLARYTARCFKTGDDSRPAPGRIGTAAAVLALLTGLVVHYSAANAAQYRVPHPTATGQTSAAVIGAAIRELDPDARIHARQWWQAPAVAYYADRMFYDLDQIPQRIFNDHTSNYYVVDDTLRAIAPHMVDSLLQRSDSVLVAEDGDFALHRIEHLYRFPPFSESDRQSDLPAMADLRDGPYPYARALERDENGYFWSRGVTAFLLRHNGEGMLKLVFWFPPLAGYGAATPTVTPIVDDIPMAPLPITHDGVVERIIPLPADFRQARGAVAVELHFSETGYRPDPRMGRQPSLYVVLIAGFTGEAP